MEMEYSRIDFKRIFAAMSDFWPMWLIDILEIQLDCTSQPPNQRPLKGAEDRIEVPTNFFSLCSAT